MHIILKFLTFATLLISVLVALLLNGTLARLGVFHYLAKISPKNTGFGPSFMASNFRDTAFNMSQLQPLPDHVILVTGSNSGVGFHSSLHLATLNTVIVMTCRSSSKCEAAADKIRKEVKGARVNTMVLDTSSLASVMKFCNAFKEKYARLDSIIFNAGIATTTTGKFEPSADGFELLFSTNHLGHFLMFRELRDLVVKTSKKYGSATLTHVASAAHFGPFVTNPITGVPLTYEKVTDPEIAYSTKGLENYSMTKLANVLFSNTIARQMQKEKLNIYSNSLHPGAVDTEIWNDVEPLLKSFLHPTIASVIYAALNKLRKDFMWTSEEGALTQVYLTASNDIISKKITGKYWHPLVSEVQAHPFALDEKIQDDFWAFSNECLKKKGF